MAKKNKNEALVKALLNLTAPKIDNSKMANQLKGFPQGMGSKQGVYNLPADYNVKNELVDAALFANSFAPVTGDIQSGIMAAQDLAKGDYGNAALNAVGMLPFVAGMGGTIKKAEKNLPLNELNTLNPTGGLYVDYTPHIRASQPLGKNMVSIDKTMGGSPDDIITIYRGAPKKQKSIVPGDFISDMQEVAKSYTGDNNVLMLKVRKGDVLDDINEPLGNEYLYRPNADKK